VKNLNFNLRYFKKNTNDLKIKKNLNSLVAEKNEILLSLSKKYKDSFDKKILLKFNKFKNIRIFGMGGSSLGTQAIYDFLKNRIKKKILFFDNLQAKDQKINKKNLNLIVSKSGNTIETIVNSNIFIKRKDHNIFITEDKNNYLNQFAQKLKADVVHHNNFIGGRYSVLSEVGMLPAELMGLKSYNFRQFDNLIKNKKFFNSLINSVGATLYYLKNKRFNSIILNYDESSNNLFNWYQQLVAESLGKKNKGLLPIVSTMPKDNHSVMQFYLDGVKNNFFTFFYVRDKKSKKINNDLILSSQSFLKNKKINDIIFSQKTATEKVFKKKNIPFRSFEVLKRDEKTLGELFSFFILETILLGKSLKLNPYDQPAVELIKKETKNLLI
jgi:glucose-6-phosphate isomerase